MVDRIDSTRTTGRTLVSAFLKGVILTGLVLLMLTNSGFSTEKYFGLQVGPTWGSVRGPGVVGWRSATGYSAGLVVARQKDNGFAVETGIFYSVERLRKAYGRVPEFGIRDAEARLTLQRWEIQPVLVKYNMPTQGSARPFLGFGPIVSYNSQAKRAEILCPPNGDCVEDIDVYNDEEWDFGYAVEGGIGFHTPGGLFTLGARYYGGLLKTVDGCTECGEELAKLSTIHLYIRYAFRK